MIINVEENDKVVILEKMPAIIRGLPRRGENLTVTTFEGKIRKVRYSSVRLMTDGEKRKLIYLPKTRVLAKDQSKIITYLAERGGKA